MVAEMVAAVAVTLVAVAEPTVGARKIGAGTLTLAGSNSYSGGTYVGYTFGTTYVASGIPRCVICVPHWLIL